MANVSIVFFGCKESPAKRGPGVLHVKLHVFVYDRALNSGASRSRKPID